MYLKCGSRLRSALFLGSTALCFGFSAAGQAPTTDQPENPRSEYGRTAADTAIERIRALAANNDPETNRHLLDVAMGRTFLQETPVQVAAIEALVENNYRSASSELSILLALHQDLRLRLAAADALLELRCDERCMLVLLVHLERIYREEQDIDQVSRARFEAAAARNNVNIGQDPSVARRLRLVEMLHKVVSGNGESALAALVQHYGVQSELPSLFALDLLTRVAVPRSCEVIARLFANRITWEADDPAKLEEVLAHQDCGE